MAPGLTLPLITFQGRSSRELPSILISKLVRGFFFGSSDILGGKLDHLLLIFFSPFSFPPFFSSESVVRADVSALFHWNVRVVFLYLTAEYQTPQFVSRGIFPPSTPLLSLSFVAILSFHFLFWVIFLPCFDWCGWEPGRERGCGLGQDCATERLEEDQGHQAGPQVHLL